MKYKIITFGCQFNVADNEKVTTVLENLGYQKTTDDNQADLVVVLACSIRQTAIDRIYGLEKKFSKIKKNKPLITALSGCILESDKVKMSKFFDLVFPITDLPKLPSILAKKVLRLPADYSEIHPSYQSSFQAYVPIMMGCNQFCSFCVVPYVRGREVSRSPKNIIKECKHLIARGYKEIILIGQTVNSYKHNQTDFSKLLQQVDAISGHFWLSFSSSHPKFMTDKLIKVMATGEHIIPYLHLPIQSGDNKMLKIMKRFYTVGQYKKIITKIRKAIPGIAVSTDIIVGFPGETKKQFAGTMQLFKDIKFDMAFLSQYSQRSHTKAAELKDNVTKDEKKRREKALNIILKKTALTHNKKLVGLTVEVLVDNYKDGFCFGKTNSYKNIKFASDIDRTGELIFIKITSCYAWGLSGELPKVVVVLGTTASGKTKLAVELAKKYDGEIISADSRQVYQGMDIGTGKDLGEYGKIPYHLIDVVSPKSQFNVADWQKLAFEKVNVILKRGKLPIICGGTGLYISALTEGYNLEIPNSKFQIPKIDLNKLSLKQLLSLLKKIDPETYKVIDQKNRRRVQRALEIFYQTGIPKSEQEDNKKPPYNFLQLGVTFPKDILHQKIDQRLVARINQEGMIDEVKKLRQQGVSWQRLNDFGLEYRWVSNFLQDKISEEELVEGLKNSIHDFAKRQMTWFRKNDDVVWLKQSSPAKTKVKQFLDK
ncbi:MAG: hypothetical protein CMI53_00620 [Parcubacteria group bacterium]|nr:hypothetical protein [Parcubacteria group bacterium]|tara:strand:+ start:13074 stop:15206 length:2133 start_codon:yes stop_codon:yes gene_type:complete